MNDLKIYMAASDETGCGLMRIQHPANELKKTFPWTEYRLGFPPSDPMLNEADVYIIQRATNEFFFDWIPKVQSEGKKVIFDIDDALWNIPASNLAHRYYPTKELKKLDKVMSLCDYLTVSTIPLKETLENKFQKEVKVLPNLLPSFDFEKPKNDKLRIGWAGSYTHNGDFDKHLVKALRDLKVKYDFEFYTFGFTPQFFKDIAISIPWAQTQTYMDKLKELNFDIGIIVAEDNHFNRCKSNLKFMEYGLTKVAPIAHNTYPYANSIIHNQDGFLIQNPKTDWKEYLELLITDEQKRKEVQDAANKTIKENYTFESKGDWLVEQYKEIFTKLGY